MKIFIELKKYWYMHRCNEVICPLPERMSTVKRQLSDKGLMPEKSSHVAALARHNVICSVPKTKTKGYTTTAMIWCCSSFYCFLFSATVSVLYPFVLGLGIKPMTLCLTRATTLLENSDYYYYFFNMEIWPSSSISYQIFVLLRQLGITVSLET